MKRRDFLHLAAGSIAASSASRGTFAFGQARARKTKRIKVGQIGTGHAHAAGKMATLRKLQDQFEVVGIAEPDPARRRAVQGHSAYRDLPWLTPEQLLNHPGLEVVAVETTVADLVPIGQTCADAGMHLHLDKPAGTSLSDFRRLLETASAKGRVVQMGYMFRYNPAFQFCFQAVREGWLGDVFEVHGVISKKVNAEARRRLSEFSGGSMFELGCHLIDALIIALGPPQRVTPYLRKTRPDQDTLADNTLAVFEYPRATCTIRSALVEVEGQRRRQFVVCGQKGTVDIRPLEPPAVRLVLDEGRAGYGRGYQDVPMPAMPGRYDEQLVTLARVVREEIDTPYLPSHDLAVHEAILRASDMDVGLP